MRQMTALFLTGVLALAAVACADEIIVHDHFDDGLLDPAWETGFDLPATGWTSSESGSWLEVTDVASAISPDWGAVNLSRSCDVPGDFVLACTVSWDCEESNRPMQGLFVGLRDSSDSWIAYCAISDGWVEHRGRIVAGGDDVDAGYSGPMDQLAFSGDADFRIERSGDALSLFWDDQLVTSGSSSEGVAERVLLSFWYCRYSTSFFGTESVDVITVTDTSTSVSPTSWSRLKALFSDGAGNAPSN